MVAVRRRFAQRERQRSLAESANWPEVPATVHQVNADLSNPREEIVYYYETQSGYHSGSYWRWFDLVDLVPIHAGDQVRIRHNPEDHDSSVFVGLPVIAGEPSIVRSIFTH